MSEQVPADPGRASPGTTMTINLLWMLPALALLPCGWFAAARVYRRKLHLLQLQLDAARQTAAEHAHQARRQIGQLQAELAARPPLPAAERERRAQAAEAAAAELRRSAASKPVPDRDFPATVLLPNGFAPTQLMP